MTPPPDLTPADVMARHQLARSTAYEHMRRALGRPRGVRGVLRVPVHVWDRYYASLSAKPGPAPAPRRWAKPTRAEQKVPPVSGIYFAQAGAGGPIKIGHASNIRKRMFDLQVANAEPLILLGVIRETHRPTVIAIERELHADLDDLRVGGEWFRCHERVLQIVRLRAEEPSP